MLVRLLYASRIVGQITADVVESIMEQSRRHNGPAGITGILCFSDDQFIQVLEGGRNQVCEMYNTIVRDQRHREIRILHYEEIAERRFANWTMGQVNLARTNPTLLLKYSETAVFDPLNCSGLASMALLDELISSGSVISRNG